ncbi:uncharacterized protein LOC124454530 [Xenia sp. Carnegie-2017]|nr:uncharacterized protein LOC124454530 [Xenia sp. Carnegie-2017]
MSSDQKNIDKKMRIFNVLQFVVHGQEETVRLDECSLVDGMFPWTLNEISVRLKCKIVDKFEHLERLEEELILIKQEMSNYLRYYKDIVIPKLKAEVKDMEQSLNSERVSVKDTRECLSNERVESEKSLYASSSHKSRRVILGEIALRYKGINFAKQQLDLGSKHFSCINSRDVLDTLVSNESDIESYSDNEDDDLFDDNGSDDKIDDC